MNQLTKYKLPVFRETKVGCNKIVKTCENWPTIKCLWKSWTVFNTMGDATDAVMVRDAIKNMLDER